MSGALGLAVFIVAVTAAVLVGTLGLLAAARIFGRCCELIHRA